MRVTKKASAEWSGSIKEGTGYISTESGVLDRRPYGFNTRFEGKPGTNPEELIAAAHSACFTMALSLFLSEANYTADKLETNAQVTIEKINEGFKITTIHLSLKAKIPGVNQTQFQEFANKAKLNCPVSKLFEGNTQISLEAMLEN